ncbi:hypothetical protein T440DRAFT_487522 [Plenodomus tracheiphilus IPT5]|uniref:CMP/dCMP-type deaminase domain-containing protein n=1 Tax=Plenodomus tracheiphilus IPT5 TaxID=1408161 RepID=A0A6A7BF63_9PLEO|nr:hypothetical protein T440DRAFT_487522 [Plenodomus tracheiphilus IPT5]
MLMMSGQISLGLDVISSPSLAINGVSYSTRAYWMRRVNAALSDLVSPCPFGAFGTVIVNHTAASDLGDLVCIGANSNQQTGNPTNHGDALKAFADLSLYTNAESCPMCASAIRWAGFREYIYGTSIDTLVQNGWGQIRISSIEVFRESFDLPNQSRLIGGILTNETNPYFTWQYNPDYPCPTGCSRSGASCVKSLAL